MYACYLRASELLHPEIQAVCLAGYAGLHHWGNQASAGVRLTDIKTGPNQFVQFDDAFLLHALPPYLNDRRTAVGPGGRLFYVSYSRLRTTLLSSLANVGLASVSFTLNRLRPGGTTTDALNGHSTGDIIRRGRRSNPRSATSYLQTGKAPFLSVKISPGVKRRQLAFLRSAQLVLQQRDVSAGFVVPGAHSQPRLPTAVDT